MLGSDSECWGKYSGLSSCLTSDDRIFYTYVYKSSPLSFTLTAYLLDILIPHTYLIVKFENNTDLTPPYYPCYAKGNKGGNIQMSKKMILTISDELDKYLKNKADNLGMSKLDYIRFTLMKEKEQDPDYSLSKNLGL